MKEKKFVLRLSEDDHKELKETAKENGRSMNSEIIYRIKNRKRK